uniref:Uncharacterized protein n=1 Tax=Globodera rostochiensis TaxID=31243 RepID=A0A914HYQ9_GLORO
MCSVNFAGQCLLQNHGLLYADRNLTLCKKLIKLMRLCLNKPAMFWDKKFRPLNFAIPLEVNKHIKSIFRQKGKLLDTKQMEFGELYQRTNNRP